MLACQQNLLAQLLPRDVQNINRISVITFPRQLPSQRCCALLRQAVERGRTLSKLYRTLFAAMPAQKQRQASVRYVGLFTDGGTDNALHQHRIDNLCATISVPYEEHCIFKLLLDPLVHPQLAEEVVWADCHTCRFSSNSWESYHSEGASNINAIGLLVVRFSASLASQNKIICQLNTANSHSTGKPIAFPYPAKNSTRHMVR